jgi:O-acetyl-ADP-ribose deacetylase (regulator of RNase III)
MQTEIKILLGNITKVIVDAIVNAANSSLLGGGGVDGAIHQAGGPQILEDCKKIITRIGKCKTGEAVITRAGNLPAKFVIHTVGPIWKDGYSDEAEDLRNCYWNSLQLALEEGVKTISFPGISTGVYGYPKHLAADIAVKTVSEFLTENEAIEKVIFVCFDEESFDLYTQLILEK